ncbi:MAG: DNA-binding protein [Desulfovibrio sp.]|uniref:DNA-binding protein n=1 Tax=Desulfovibrio sp. 7SRBS1 TaxID=3378064 RepID=UPI003B3FAE9F
MIRPEYLNLKNAAVYCGYNSARSFSNLIKEYELPKYGPNRNRYKVSDLDDFMESPTSFVAAPVRRRTGFTPVEI